MNILHFFNPGHENAVLNRLPSYTAPASLATIQKDLASLPSWYAAEDDLVLVDEAFDRGYHKYMQEEGFCISNLLINSDLSKYNKLKVCMWGIAPQTIRLFENYNKNYSLDIMIPEWNDKYIYYNSRKFSKDVLAEFLKSNVHFQSLQIPQFFDDLNSLENFVTIQNTKLLVKSPYSSSGRGLLWIPKTGISRTERQLLQGMFKRQGEVSVEPIYGKQLDFAMEFMSDGGGGVDFVGYSLFSTNEKGVYTGNVLISQSDILHKLLEYVDEIVLDNVKLKLKEIFSTSCALDYSGCIGVDMMIYTHEGDTKLHPCVEINMRYNMGYLSLKLYDNHMIRDAKGVFNIEFDTDGKALIKHQQMEIEFPLVIENGRVKSGYLSLCPVDKRTCYRAYMLVE